MEQRMSEDAQAGKEKSTISISGTNVNIEGDVIGGDKIINNYNPTFISNQFELIKKLVENQSRNKDDLRNAVDQIEEEVPKGDSADLAKVEKWLKFLSGISDDIFQVTVSTLINPIGGIAKAIQLIAKKVKEENS
jgi:hypothetical protein